MNKQAAMFSCVQKGIFIMKTLICINIVNVILLAILTISYIMMDMPTAFLIIFAIWILYVCAINYAILVKSKDKIATLNRADKKHLFTPQINTLTKLLQSVEFYRQIFSKYDETSSVKETFNMLSDDAYLTVDKAIKWINSYDHNTCPTTEYIVNLAERAATIISKLNELNETLIRIEDSTQADTMEDVDDLLKSLKEILKDE